MKNEIRIVQASLLGSILANLLLILGMCFLFGGLRYREQIYNSTVTQMSACLLSLSVTSLLLPTAFHASFSNNSTADDKVLQVSRGVSVILLLVYVLYLLFQLNSHSYMYESTPREVIERETHPGPAAQYFNSSSGSDTSSSSSSDTDDSAQSTTTAKKIRRMMRRAKRSRKASTSTTLPEEATASGSTEPASTEITSDIAGRDGQGSDIQRTVSVERDGVTSMPADVVAALGADEAVDAGDEMAEEPRESRQKHKHKRRHHHRRKARSDDGNELEQTQSAPAQGEGDDRRVEFAVQDVESQPQTAAAKPFALRLLRPNITKSLTQSVFSTQTSGAGASSTAARPQSVRRINSLPLDTRSPRYRTSPGVLPPIVPIVVNSARKTQTPEEEEHAPEAEISRTTAVLLLLCSTGLVALCAEFMVGSINAVVSSGSGLSEAFIGLILLPIVGNAAEHVTAVTVAMKNKMDLAIGVALGSSIQIAIFVTPFIVILGWIMNKEMSLYFTLFETVSMFVSAFIVNFLVLDGRSNYLEGALLCAAYVIIAVAAFFYPDAEAANSLGGGDADGNVTESVVVGAKLLARGFASLAGVMT